MKHRIPVLVALVVLVCSACIRVEVDLVVEDDGTLEYGGIVAADPDAIARITELFGGLEDFEDLGAEAPVEVPGRDEICADFVAEQGLDIDGAEGIESSVEPYDEDGFCGVRFQVSGPVDQATPLLAETGDNPITLAEQDDGGWLFSLPLDGTEDAGDLADFPGLGDVFDDASYVVRVKLPGRQVEHNADEITSDGTLVWDLDLLDPPTEGLFARTEPGETITGDGDGAAGSSAGATDDDGGTPWLLVVVALAVVAALVGLAVVLLGRRSRSSAGARPADPVSPTTPAVISSPTPDQATGTSVWDPVRRAYVQWDPSGGRWMVFDDTSRQWRTEG